MPDFHEYYAAGTPPWDIGRPQPSFVSLEEKGEIKGSVLDLGCGTGENALYLASRGHSVVGLDLVPLAIEQAKKKAIERSISCEFKVADALALEGLNTTFESVIDSGVFHVFSDEDRITYVQSLRKVLKPNGKYFMLVFSDSETREGGPRRISKLDIHQAFESGWKIESVTPTTFDATLHAGGSRAWLGVIQRVA